MKLLIISDLHGSDRWKLPVNNETYDKVIFLGDYLDSRSISYDKQISNFNEIIEFKKSNRKAILLLGNHEYHYLPNVTQKYSGFSPFLKLILENNLNFYVKTGLLKLGYLIDNIVITHAGVTNTWAKNNNININNLNYSLNKTLKENIKSLEFRKENPQDFYGDDIIHSPIWVRPKSLLTDKLNGFYQIVGHTEINKPTLTDNILFTDCKDYYVLVETTNFELTIKSY